MSVRRHVVLLLALAVVDCGGAENNGGGNDDEGTAAAPAPLTRPLDPDIWLADLAPAPDGTLTLSDVRVAIHREGYDNQPAFLPDGSAFWFTATDTHDGQSDIWRFDLAGGVARVTMSAPESEYSAAPLPDGSGLSAVRVEADSTQRLWRFDLEGSDARPLLPDVAPVGYYAWSAAGPLVLFVLGDPPTLRVADPDGRGARTVATDVARSIQPIPGSGEVSYVQLGEAGTGTVMRLDPTTGERSILIDAPEGAVDHAWTPDGRLLMSHESSIYVWSPGSGGDWTLLADLSDHGVVVSRLAVSPDGTHLALVVEPGRLPM